MFQRRNTQCLLSAKEAITEEKLKIKPGFCSQVPETKGKKDSILKIKSTL